MKRLYVASNRSITPKGVRTKAGVEWTQETLAALGRKMGVQFVVHAGLLAVSSESAGGKVTSKAHVYADVLSVEAGVMKRVEAEGTGAQRSTDADAAIQLGSAGFRSREFQNASVGQALSRAIEELAALVYQSTTGLSDTPGQRTATRPGDTAPDNPETSTEVAPEAGQDDSSATAEAQEAASDEELQQLIGQAEECLSNRSTLSPEKINSLIQALEGLKSALENKSKLLEQGNAAETEQADQQIDSQTENLKDTVSQVSSDDSSQTSSADSGAVSEGSKWDKWFDRITKAADFAFGFIQKIQDMRATYRRVQQDSSAGELDEQEQPSEEPLGGLSGAVTDQNGPVEGADVNIEPAGSEAASVVGALTGDPHSSSSLPAAIAPSYRSRAYSSRGLRVWAAKQILVTGISTVNHKRSNGSAVWTATTGSTSAMPRARTDSSGFYSISGIPAGKGKLVITKGGRRLADIPITVVRGRTKPVDVPLNSISLRGRIGSAQLTRVLPSRVAVNRSGGSTGSLKGVVQDVEGRPMPRALVHLENLAIARTDSQGRFLFTNVPTGAKQLTVRASDLKPRSERVSILSNKVIDSTIKFGLGEKIVKVRETLLAPNTNTALSGKVLDNRSNPVSGAKVSVVGLAKAAYVRTHADGSYEMRGLKPGQYQVLVSRVGYADANQTVSLRAGLREQRAFRIAQTNSQIERDLVQRVVTRLCEIRGQVRAVNGGPVPYATVELKAAARGSNGATFKTNSRGEYSFKAIAGRYELKVKAKNFQEATGIATLQVGNSARKDFDLKPDGSSTNAGGTRPETGRLSGRVTDGINAKPIPGAIVSIEGQKATTDRSGSYTVSNLAKGNHRVTVSKSGYSDETAQVAIQADGSTQKYFAMRPKAAPDRPPDALRPGHLNGRITDERTGKPIVGASVSVLGRTIVTDRTGNYAVTDLPRGKHQVSVTSRGYHNDRETVEVRAGSSTNKDFKLKSASGSAGGDLPRGTGQLRGRVTEAGTGRLISGARISISGQGSATTDSGGNYTITNLRPGKYPVRVTSSRYLSKTEDIEIKAGSSTNRIFVLEPASNGNRNTSTSGNRNSKSGKSPRQIRN